MAKESLFNVLSNHFDFDELVVLDLFAGTGSISFEFASRGCAKIGSVDINHRCLDFIKQTSDKLNISNIRTFKSDVFKFIKMAKGPYDIIFADPPYNLKGLENIPDLVFENNILASEGWMILEHPSEYDFSQHPFFQQHRKYGHVHFSIFACE